MTKFDIILNEQKVSEELLRHHTNRVSTTLYTIYTFIPLGIFNQLKQATNLYFVLISVVACIPQVSSIDKFSAIFPTVWVIFFSLAFDWYDDLKRYISDVKINRTKITLIRNGVILEAQSQDIQIGDLVYLAENDRAMADIVLLSYISTNEYCYIDTSNLDGEKTLKPKVSILEKDLVVDKFRGQDVDSYLQELHIDYRENVDDLHSFEGNVHLEYGQKKQPQNEQIRLDISNFIPRSAMIRNTDKVIGLVVYVGKNTKIMKNMQDRIFKKSSLEKKMNRYIILVLFILFTLLLILSFCMLGFVIDFNYEDQILDHYVNPGLNFLYVILAYLLLMNIILPLSLVITLQILRIVQNFYFVQDERYHDKENNKFPRVNSVNLNDQLGKVEYILSDKTGTLTQNKMIAKYFQIQNNKVPLFDGYQLRRNQTIKNQNSTHLQSQVDENQLKTNNSTYSDFQKFSLNSIDGKESYNLENQQQLDFLFLLLINICHDCFAKSKEQDISESVNSIIEAVDFEGPSPDEIALLRGSRDHCGLILKGQNAKTVILEDSKNQIYEVEKYFTFKFDSHRKLMSIIIKYQNKYFLLTKGADNAVADRATNGKIDQLPQYFSESVDSYLEMGLRVMFMGIKLLSFDELDKFLKDLQQMENDPNTSNDEIYDKKCSIEKDLFIIGASAIEDKLQDNLKETVEILKVAGIKIWVITGDKQETAKNIAFASGLFEKNQEPVYLNENILNSILQIEDEEEKEKPQKQQNFRWRLNKTKVLNIPSFKEIEPHMGIVRSNTAKISLQIRKAKIPKENLKYNLLVSGKILAQAISSKKVRKFTEYLMQFQCVVFSRTNPKQKVQIVRLLKNKKIKTLAVGDGANDVNMIQEADVGIGIIGEEGKQAISASDFAVPYFRHLRYLILQLGRTSYYNNSILILFFFYKNVLFTLEHFYFAFQTYYSYEGVYNDWYQSVYNLFFTAFIISAIAIENTDLDLKAKYYDSECTLEAYVYFQTQNSIMFNLKKFIGWLVVCVLESFYIYLILQFCLRGDIYSEGHEIEFDVFSFLLVTILLLVQMMKIPYIVYQWGFWSILGTLVSWGLFVSYVFGSNHVEVYGYYNVVEKTRGAQIFYIYLIFFTLSLLFFNNLFFQIKRQYFPSIKDKIRNMKKFEGKVEEIQQLEMWREQDLKKNLKNFEINLLMERYLNNDQIINFHRIREDVLQPEKNTIIISENKRIFTNMVLQYPQSEKELKIKLLKEFKTFFKNNLLKIYAINNSFVLELLIKEALVEDNDIQMYSMISLEMLCREKLSKFKLHELHPSLKAIIHHLDNQNFKTRKSAQMIIYHLSQEEQLIDWLRNQNIFQYILDLLTIETNHFLIYLENKTVGNFLITQTTSLLCLSMAMEDVFEENFYQNSILILNQSINNLLLMSYMKEGKRRIVEKKIYQNIYEYIIKYLQDGEEEFDYQQQEQDSMEEFTLLDQDNMESIQWDVILNFFSSCAILVEAKKYFSDKKTHEEILKQIFYHNLSDEVFLSFLMFLQCIVEEHSVREDLKNRVDNFYLLLKRRKDDIRFKQVLEDLIGMIEWNA